MKRFDSKIEPILTYGSIIWGIENSNNTIIIDGLKEIEQETTKNQVAKVFRECFSTLYKLYAVPVRVCSTREDMHYP